MDGHEASGTSASVSISMQSFLGCTKNMSRCCFCSGFPKSCKTPINVSSKMCHVYWGSTCFWGTPILGNTQQHLVVSTPASQPLGHKGSEFKQVSASAVPAEPSKQYHHPALSHRQPTGFLQMLAEYQKRPRYHASNIWQVIEIEPIRSHDWVHHS